MDKSEKSPFSCQEKKSGAEREVTSSSVRGEEIQPFLQRKIPILLPFFGIAIPMSVVYPFDVYSFVLAFRFSLNIPLLLCTRV